MAATDEQYRRLDRLAQRQYGLVTSGQLQRIGFDVSARNHLADRARLVGVRRGVYRVCGSEVGWRSTALAAVLAAGQGGTRALLSHRSAAVVWDLVDGHHVAGPLHVTVPPDRQVRLLGVVAHRGDLHAGLDVAERHRIPVTSVERTLLDVSGGGAGGVAPALVSAGADGETEAMGRMVDEALRRRLTTMSRLLNAADLGHSQGRRRLGPMRRLLADRGVGYNPGANDWERRMDMLWERMALPQATRQYAIRLPNGRQVRPDRAILESRIAVDWNGYGTHGDRTGFEHDIERRNLLIAAGWTPLEFHSNQSAEHIARTVLQAHKRCRAASLPAS